MTSDREANRAFPCFALLWALATLVHQLSFTFWLQTWPGWLLTFATCLVVLEPRCVIRFLVMLVFSLINLWYRLPDVPNHMLFEGMANLTLLIAIVGVVATPGSGYPTWREMGREFWVRFRWFFLSCGVKAVFLEVSQPPRNPVLGGVTSALLLMGLGQGLAGHPPVTIRAEQMFARFAPILRVQLAMVYWWAAVQKLNWDYFNPSVSCAVQLHREMAEFLPFLPTGQWISYAAIYGSLALEICIPFLLLWPRTRRFGFAVGVLFHLWLSIHPAGGIYSFSALILAFYFAFLPASAIPEWRRLLVAQRDWLQGKVPGISLETWLPRLVIGLFLAVVIAQAACYTVLGRSRETFDVANRIGFWLWFVFGIWAGWNCIHASWRMAKGSQQWPNRAEWSLAWLLVLPVAGNGLSPWIGLKTQTCFSMYSNLRSEGNGNHLFLRRVDLFGYQEDMVKLVESQPDLLDPTDSPTRLQHFANPGRIFPYFELRRIVTEHSGDLRLVYWRHGEIVTAERKGGVIAAKDPHLFEPIPTPLRKFLWFRRFETLTGPMYCTH